MLLLAPVDLRGIPWRDSADRMGCIWRRTADAYILAAYRPLPQERGDLFSRSSQWTKKFADYLQTEWN